jgi:hypothetical protein
MSRARLDRFVLAERLRAVALDGVPLAAAEAAEAASLVEPEGLIAAWDPAQASCTRCGALGARLEDDVRVCWTCLRTWRGRAE